MIALDWTAIEDSLERRGFAETPALLSSTDCRTLAALYDDESRFRKKIVMTRHGFGSGEYQYFAEPLPASVARLREGLYGPLRRIANAWAERLGEARRYPPTLEAFRAECRAAGQDKPTPLLLRYGPGDFNRLHQDLYGEIVFPLQVVLLLDRPGVDFEGGEFVLTEQRPRMQSRASVAAMSQGTGVVFPVAQRPVRGARGDHRAAMRHGVSEIRRGRRHTLGIIFHDAG